MIEKKDLKIYADKIIAFAKANKKVLKIAAVLIVLMMITSHIKSCMVEKEKAKPQPMPVTVGVAKTQDVPISIESFGTLSSPESVDIKAQVTGKILEVNYKQGSEVAKGDLLFTIDPKKFNAQVAKAEAQLAEDKANLELQKELSVRNKPMYEKKLISEQNYDQIKTGVTALEAQVELDKADLRLAQINLDYCYIKSPIDGLAGKRQVDIGNIIPENTGPTLTNVKAIDELYVDFTLPERDLPKVRKAMNEGTLKVEITVTGEENDPKSGELEFVDNSVNVGTGTIYLRAIVKNNDRSLWPGQFCTVRLYLGVEKGVVTVPYEAAQLGKKGYYAFVVKKNIADLRSITVGEKNEDYIVVEKGIKEGETVVTTGQMGIAPGMPVFDTTKETDAKKTKDKS